MRTYPSRAETDWILGAWDRYQLYLLAMPHMRIPSLKLGITNVYGESDRVEILTRRHRATVECVWVLEDYVRAAYIERFMLRTMWGHYRQSLHRSDMPRGGFTETKALSDVSIARAIADIDNRLLYETHVKTRYQCHYDPSLWWLREKTA